MTEVRSILEKELEGLVGLAIFSAVVTEDACLVLDLGARRRRAEPLRNPALSEEQRLYEGTTQLLIRCAWRLDSTSDVIVGFDDELVGRTPWVPALQSLIGVPIARVDVNPPALDLTLTFPSGLTLQIFCDRTDEEDCENYSFATENHCYLVGPGHRIEDEPRP